MSKQMAAMSIAVVLSGGLFNVLPISAQVDVLTYRYENTRLGANLNETKLKKANVSDTKFGKLAFRNVDGNIFAQPLVVTQASIVNRPSPVNIVIVATEHNSVYAFDADDTSADPPMGESTKALWHTAPGTPGLGNSLDSQILSNKLNLGPAGCTDITTEIGITSTPAIKLTKTTSPKQGVIFLAAKSFADANHFPYTLVALNLADGTALGNGSPIQGSVTGPNGTTINFDPIIELNRPALLLDGNTLYIAFGGHCDTGNYRGWIFAYDVSNPSSPQKLDVLSTTITPRNNDLNGRGGIWMSGFGPAAVDGSVFFTTGDGSYNTSNPSSLELADSVVKTGLVSGKIQVKDWFAPLNAQEMNNQNGFNLKSFDLDLGSGGPVLLPNSHLLLAGGKEGRFYLLDRNALGKGTTLSLHSLQVTRPPQPRVPHPVRPEDLLSWNIHGAPVIWPQANQMFAYVMGEEDFLKQYRLIPDASSGWKFAADPPFGKSGESVGLPPPNVINDPTRQSVFMPGGFLTLSAQGADATTGIVWATMPFADNANRAVVKGVLRAFDAEDVSRKELWDSEKSGTDGLGFFARFNPPVVANGKVFVTAFQQESFDTRTGIHSKAPGGLMPALVMYGLK